MTNNAPRDFFLFFSDTEKLLKGAALGGHVR